MNYWDLLWNFFKLRGNTKKSKAGLQNLQEKKRRRLLTYAYDYSAYYRKRFEQAGITREQIAKLPLQAFPTMDKKELLEHFDELVTADDLKQAELRQFDALESERKKAYRGKYHVVHSSGSSGQPGYFVYDGEAWNQMLLAIIRGALWGMGTLQILKFLRSGPRIAYIAATDGRYGGAMAVGGGMDGVRAHQLFIDVKTPLPELVRQVREFQPNMIIGYPSAIKILADLAESGNVQLDIFRVVSCGEPLDAGMRASLENTFQADVVNFYGASESLALGVETSQTNGMVLFDDMNVIEVEDGKMYLTCLYNFVQPLIRYQISDQLVLKEPESRCPFTKAEILLGRSEDLLWFEDGNGSRDFLHPLAIEGFCISGLRDYQFRQTGRASFEMLAEVSGEHCKEAVRSEMLRRMREILMEKQLGYVRFDVQFTAAILPDPRTGKKKLISSRREEFPSRAAQAPAFRTAEGKRPGPAVPWNLGNAV